MDINGDVIDVEEEITKNNGEASILKLLVLHTWEGRCRGSVYKIQNLGS